MQQPSHQPRRQDRSVIVGGKVQCGGSYRRGNASPYPANGESPAANLAALQQCGNPCHAASTGSARRQHAVQATCPKRLIVPCWPRIKTVGRASGDLLTDVPRPRLRHRPHIIACVARDDGGGDRPIPRNVRLRKIKLGGADGDG